MQNGDRTRRFFDAYAANFNALYGSNQGILASVINSLFRRSMKRRFERSLAACGRDPAASVLDIGCGPGHYCIALARHGLSDIWGIDFAPRMIALAQSAAKRAGVADRCQFIADDFLAHEFNRTFDYCILMGFMDYVAEPLPIIEKALDSCSRSALFSFPAAEGFLAWQRRLRYRNRCNLYLYTRKNLEDILYWFRAYDVEIKKIGRDYFVTISR